MADQQRHDLDPRGSPWYVLAFCEGFIRMALRDPPDVDPALGRDILDMIREVRAQVEVTARG